MKKVFVICVGLLMMVGCVSKTEPTTTDDELLFGGVCTLDSVSEQESVVSDCD